MSTFYPLVNPPFLFSILLFKNKKRRLLYRPSIVRFFRSNFEGRCNFLFFKYLFFLLHFYLIWNKRNSSILTSYIITSYSSKSIFTECLIFQASLYKILIFYKVRCPYLLLLFSRHLTKQFYLHFLLF